MLDSLFSSIENAFVQPSFKRLLYIFFLLLIVLSFLFIFNELTGYTLYSRVDKRITVLKGYRHLKKRTSNNRLILTQSINRYLMT